MHFLITGTGTMVGKTYITCGLTRAARDQGIDCIAMKPVCTGDQEDVRRLQAANGTAEADYRINPLWFHTPLAPLAAAMVEERRVDLEAMRHAYGHLRARHQLVLVEGAGGLLVPITTEYDFRDLAADLGLAVIVVAANRLGAINEIRLTREALARSNLSCRGIILNALAENSDLAVHTNRSVLELLLDVPILDVHFGQTDFSEILRQIVGHDYFESAVRAHT